MGIMGMISMAKQKFTKTNLEYAEALKEAKQERLKIEGRAKLKQKLRQEKARTRAVRLAPIVNAGKSIKQGMKRMKEKEKKKEKMMDSPFYPSKKKSEYGFGPS